MLDIAAVLLTLTAVLSYLNHRFIKLPGPVGVMALALLMSLLLMLVGLWDRSVINTAHGFITQIDFSAVLLNGMLSFLLFAGALHVDLSELASRKWAIGLLASVGVIASTLIIGGSAWLLFDGLLGLNVPLLYWMLLGAILSPTDPIAVLGVMKAANAPRDLEIKIVGESLFNDGIAVVVFLILLAMLSSGQEDVELLEAMQLFAQETLGGAALGLVLGYGVFLLMRRIDDYTVEVLLTLALVVGGFSLAQHLHISGPITMVVAGLLIGNRGRMLAMSAHTRERLDDFWEMLDEILNAVLFVLIGLEVLILTVTREYLILAAITIVLMLLVRFICVGLPISALRVLGREYSRYAVRLLTWGGIRGGISVALALSLPPSKERDMILTVTYIVVLFSILVQGLSLGPVIRLALGRAKSPPETAPNNSPFPPPH